MWRQNLTKTYGILRFTHGFTAILVCMVHCTESVGVQTLVLMHIVSADHIFVDCLPSPRGCLRPETSRGVVSSPLKCRDSRALALGLAVDD